MSDLTEKFTTFEEQIAAEHTDLMEKVDTIDTNVGNLGEAITTLNNSLVAAIRSIQLTAGANDPCACGSTPTLRVPPTGTTPIGISEEQCQRIQAFLHTMQEIFTVLDAASAFNVGLNFSLIYNSFNEVITSIESGSGLPVISYPEAVQLVGLMITYIADNIFRGDTLSSQFSSILFDLRDGMSLAVDAASAQSAYNSTIDASSLPSDEKEVIKGAAYNAIYTYYFDPESSPDLSGYDGTACAPDLTLITACVTFPSVDQVGGGHTFKRMAMPATASDGVSTLGNFNGFSIHVLTTVGEHAVSVYYKETEPGDFIFVDQRTHGSSAIPFTHDTASIYARGTDFDGDGTDFTAEICPPE